MDCAVNDTRIKPDMFHNVDFAAIGPSIAVSIALPFGHRGITGGGKLKRIRRQHPNRGPRALTSGQLSPHLNLPVLQIQ